ncbi:MAG: AmmeMemoRadiSam system radical SAM enzyme, partial [Thermoproteota archaeon]
DKLENKVVRCNACFRKCTISEGKLGFCRVKKNINGKLYSLVYGKLVAENLDPIEKKPLFHFWPGGTAYSIATVGCNYRCAFCCNWDISQEREIIGNNRTPEEVVDQARKYKATAISYTYTEPTINLEFAYDTSKVANQYGIKNTFVTNGSMSIEAIDLISKYLDAATVDFKGNANKNFYLKRMAVPGVDHIFEGLLALKEKKVHTEITNLVVPKEGDSLEDLKTLVKWVVNNLGPDVPFHVLRFFPNYLMNDVPPTPVETIEKSIKLAKDLGLRYVYAGNLPGHRSENTYCPNCGALLIERNGFFVTKVNLTQDNRCPKCGEKIPIVGEAKVSNFSFI